MRRLFYYGVAIFLGLGGFEMVITMPMNFAYATAFLYFQNKNREVTGRKHTLAEALVFLTTIIMGRLSIPIASDAGSPDYILTSVILNIPVPELYESFLPYFVLGLLLYSIFFTVVSRRWSQGYLPIYYAIIGSVVLVLVHIFPLMSALETRSDLAKFIETAPALYAKETTGGPGIESRPPIVTSHSDRIYADENNYGIILYSDTKGGQLVQYVRSYPFDRHPRDLLYISRSGSIMRVVLPNDDWYIKGISEVGSDLYLFSVYNYDETVTYKVTDVVE